MMDDFDGLDARQQARALALGFARAALVDSGSAVVIASDTLPERFGSQDLIDVAQWIVDGTDPLKVFRDERADAPWLDKKPEPGEREYEEPRPRPIKDSPQA